MQGPLEAPGNRGQKTQRVSSFSFLVTLFPHTVDYCLSYKPLHRRGHGQGLATHWPASLSSDVGVVRESALLLSLGIRVSGSRAGRRREAKGCMHHVSLTSWEAVRPPPTPPLLCKVKSYSLEAGGSSTAFLGRVIV